MTLESTGSPVKFLVDPFEVRRAAAALLTVIPMLEAATLAQSGRPIAFVFGQATLAPIISDILKLATKCGLTASNYETCEATLSPTIVKKVESLEPLLVRAAAGSTLSAGNLLGFSESPVFAQETGKVHRSFPNSLPALLGRLATVARSGEVGVEVSRETGPRHFNLYLGGTQSWSLKNSKTAFDVTSDVAAMSGPSHSGAERVALRALKQAGFGSQVGDSVTVVGYSEGALIGANLIAGGAVASLGGSVKGLVSVGGPISAIRLPKSLKVLSLEHANDLVTKLDLAERPNTGNWQTVKLNPVGLMGHDLGSYRNGFALLPKETQARLYSEFGDLLGQGRATDLSYSPLRVGTGGQ